MLADLRFRVRDIPWIWTVLRPDMRFMIQQDPDEGYAWCWMEQWMLDFCLGKEYERQIRDELRDPEWPCPYWDRREEEQTVVGYFDKAFGDAPIRFISSNECKGLPGMSAGFANISEVRFSVRG